MRVRIRAIDSRWNCTCLFCWTPEHVLQHGRLLYFTVNALVRERVSERLHAGNEPWHM